MYTRTACEPTWVITLCWAGHICRRALETITISRVRVASDLEHRFFYTTTTMTTMTTPPAAIALEKHVWQHFRPRLSCDYYDCDGADMIGHSSISISIIFASMSLRQDKNRAVLGAVLRAKTIQDSTPCRTPKTSRTRLHDSEKARKRLLSNERSRRVRKRVSLHLYQTSIILTDIL